MARKNGETGKKNLKPDAARRLQGVWRNILLFQREEAKISVAVGQRPERMARKLRKEIAMGFIRGIPLPGRIGRGP